MQIKVSKTFAKFINQTARENGLKFEANYIEMGERFYNYYVGACWGSWHDYNAETGKYKVIQIVYPYDDHAATVQLSSARLWNLCDRYGVKTADDLKNMLIDVLSI